MRDGSQLRSSSDRNGRRSRTSPDGSSAGLAVLYLKRAISGPHEAPGAEVLENALDHRHELGVRLLFSPECVKCRDLYMHMLVFGEAAQQADVGITDGAIGSDPRQVVDGYWRLRKTAAHAIECPEGVRIDQRADGQALCGVAPPHGAHARRIQPNVGLISGSNTEPAHTLAGQPAHFNIGMGSARIHDSNTGEDSVIRANRSNMYELSNK